MNPGTQKILIAVLAVLVFALAGVAGYLGWQLKNKSSETPPPGTTGGGGEGTGGESTGGEETTPPSEPEGTDGAKTIKVYFSKDPSSYDDPTIAVFVTRQTDRVDVGTFALEHLIFGPTEEEQTGGLFTPLELSGTSNCGGKDFTLSVDQTKKEALLKFCRQIQTAGVGDDARIQTVIEKTLMQFPTVETVVILTSEDHCFGDESGMDTCKT